jgi:hypothetical protein
LAVGQAESGAVGIGVEGFVTVLAFGLEFAEFGGGLMKQAMSLGPGAIDGSLDLLGSGVGRFHGIEDVTRATVEADDKVGFNFTAAAETPHRAMDFLGENLFEEADGGEVAGESYADCRVGAFFARADEIAGEKAERDGVFGRCGFAFGGAGTRGGLSVRDVGCDLGWGRHWLKSFSSFQFFGPLEGGGLSSEVRVERRRTGFLGFGL